MKDRALSGKKKNEIGKKAEREKDTLESKVRRRIWSAEKRVASVKDREVKLNQSAKERKQGAIG